MGRRRSGYRALKMKDRLAADFGAPLPSRARAPRPVVLGMTCPMCPLARESFGSRREFLNHVDVCALPAVR